MKSANSPANCPPFPKGFTLVELLVALALSLFLIGGVLLMYTSGRAASLDAERLSRMQESIRFASDHLVRDIRNAGFRDHLSLTFPQFEDIGEAYAQIQPNGNGGNGNRLVIRYAGRGSCAERFEQLKLVENHYFHENGNLRCRGIGTDPQDNQTDRTVSLVTGLESLSFAFYPDDMASVCDFSTTDALADACTGVRIRLEFEGLDQNDEPRTAELTAAFRNVIVDRVYGR